jgi:hypothetical protein
MQNVSEDGFIKNLCSRGWSSKSSPISTQSNLFHSELFSQLDVKDPLIQLANTINWTVFDDAFEQHALPVG